MPITSQLDEARARLQQYRTRGRVAVAQPGGGGAEAAGATSPRTAHPKNVSSRLAPPPPPSHPQLQSEALLTPARLMKGETQATT
ncbi:Protein of unknown function [Gryllus bimaculatus]|nr:Protein of unknown function [Gryllus bimaculatus]